MATTPSWGLPIWDAQAGDAQWNSASNWNPDSVPNNTSDVFLSSGVAFGSVINIGTPTASANSLTIQTANPFDLVGTLDLVTGNVSRQDVAGEESEQFLDRVRTNNSPSTWTVAGSGMLHVNNVIAVTGGIGFTMTKEGAGLLSVQLSNWRGATNVNQGILRLHNLASHLGTMTISPGAQLQLVNAGVHNPPVTLNGSPLFGSGVLRNLSGISGVGPITLGGSAQISSDDGTLSVNGITDGAGTRGFAKNGAGTVILNGAGTYDGTAFVNAGTLIVAVNSALGTGTAGVGPAGTLQINSGLTVSNTINLNGMMSTPTGSVTVSGGVNMTGDATADVGNAATMTFSAPTTDSAGASTLTKSGPGTLVLNRLDAGGGLNILDGNVEFTTNGTPASTSRMRSLNLGPSARLDVKDNHLIIDYADDAASPELAIRNLVFDGLHTASGIKSLATSANDTVLAVAERTEWGQTVFNGETLDDTTIVCKYTYYGDSNLDGEVTSDDYVAIDVGLGNGNSWVEGDFDFSGSVTSDDYVAIDVNLGKGSGDPLAFGALKAEMIDLHTAMFGASYVAKLSDAEANGFGATLVPEPSAGVLLGAGLVALARRRRKSA